MPTVNIHAAKTHLSRLVDEAARGQEIIIARAGKPVAKLVPLNTPTGVTRRVLGRFRGEFTVPADFDAPLPEDVLNLFDGS